MKPLSGAARPPAGRPVVLVSRDIEFVFPLSYAYLAGYLREAGEDVRLLFRSHDRPKEELIREIMALDPLLVGFGNLYPELEEIRTLIALLTRAGRRFPVVIGGQMVTPIPEFAVKVTGADFGVLGEGEITLHRLVCALREGRDPATVRGLVIRRGNETFLTGPGDCIEDLARLPKIPYDLFPTEKWLCIGQWYARHLPHPHWHYNDRVINVHGGRGCPFTCNFCYHHSAPRYRPVDLIMGEAAEAVERFNGNVLYFSDETTLPSPGRVREVVSALDRFPRRVEYSVSSRFDILARMDDGLLREMKRTGCRIMGLGIESGSDRILKVIGKNFTADVVRAGVARLQGAGIIPTVSIMVGQYTETVEDVEASIALVRDAVRMCHNIQFAFTITTPFPGSRLHQLLFEKGLLRDEQEFYDRYFQAPGDFKYVVNLSAMSDATLLAMHSKIERVYQEERARAVPARALKVESWIPRLAVKNQWMEKVFFPSMMNSRKLKRSVIGLRLVPVAGRAWRALHHFIQNRLDKARLRLRGIPVKGI